MQLIRNLKHKVDAAAPALNYNIISYFNFYSNSVGNIGLLSTKYALVEYQSKLSSVSSEYYHDIDFSNTDKPTNIQQFQRASLRTYTK